MSRCPKCKEEIDYLFSYRIKSIKSKFKPGENPIPTLSNEIYREEYCCPVCSSILAYNAMQAADLLEFKEDGGE